jgi:hypothetical protein
MPTRRCNAPPSQLLPCRLLARTVPADLACAREPGHRSGGLARPLRQGQAGGQVGGLPSLDPFPQWWGVSTIRVRSTESMLWVRQNWGLIWGCVGGPRKLRHCLLNALIASQQTHTVTHGLTLSAVHYLVPEILAPIAELIDNYADQGQALYNIEHMFGHVVAWELVGVVLPQRRRNAATLGGGHWEGLPYPLAVALSELAVGGTATPSIGLMRTQVLPAVDNKPMPQCV